MFNQLTSHPQISLKFITNSYVSEKGRRNFFEGCFISNEHQTFETFITFLSIIKSYQSKLKTPPRNPTKYPEENLSREIGNLKPPQIHEKYSA
jgi:hypothetical protein